MKHSSNGILVVLIVALCGLTACGKKKEETATAAQNASTPAIKTFKITANDTMKYNVNRLEVKAGEQVKIVLTNIGTMPKQAMAHNWILLKQGVDAQAFDLAAASAAATEYFPRQLSDEVIAHTKLLGPKQHDEITFTAPSTPGERTFLCSFPGHFQAGMKGVLDVS